MNAPGGLSERQVQRSILKMAGVAFPFVFIAHVPNGAHLAGNAQARFKQMGALKGDGLKPGFADLICLWRGKGLLLEVKSATGRLTDSQKELFPRLEAVGWPVTVVRSDVEAYRALKEAGAPWSGQEWECR